MQSPPRKVHDHPPDAASSEPPTGAFEEPTRAPQIDRARPGLVLARRSAASAAPNVIVISLDAPRRSSSTSTRVRARDRPLSQGLERRPRARWPVELEQQRPGALLTR